MLPRQAAWLEGYHKALSVPQYFLFWFDSKAPSQWKSPTSYKIKRKLSPGNHLSVWRRKGDTFDFAMSTLTKLNLADWWFPEVWWAMETVNFRELEAGQELTLSGWNREPSKRDPWEWIDLKGAEKRHIIQNGTKVPTFYLGPVLIIALPLGSYMYHSVLSWANTMESCVFYISI